MIKIISFLHTLLLPLPTAVYKFMKKKRNLKEIVNSTDRENGKIVKGRKFFFGGEKRKILLGVDGKIMSNSFHEYGIFPFPPYIVVRLEEGDDYCRCS